MRPKSINDRMNTCTDCNFTAFFMYKDATNCHLCPICNQSDIQAFKDMISDIEDDLECNIENDLESDILELSF